MNLTVKLPDILKHLAELGEKGSDLQNEFDKAHDLYIEKMIDPNTPADEIEETLRLLQNELSGKVGLLNTDSMAEMLEDVLDKMRVHAY